MHLKTGCRQGGARWDFMGGPIGWGRDVLAPGSPCAAKQGYGGGLCADLERPCVSRKPLYNSPGMPLAAEGLEGGFLNTGAKIW